MREPNLTPHEIDPKADTVHCTFFKMGFLGIDSVSLANEVNNSNLNRGLKIKSDFGNCPSDDAGCHLIFTNITDASAKMIAGGGESQVAVTKTNESIAFFEKPAFADLANVYNMDLKTGIIVGTKNISSSFIGKTKYGAIYIGSCHN